MLQFCVLYFVICASRLEFLHLIQADDQQAFPIDCNKLLVTVQEFQYILQIAHREGINREFSLPNRKKTIGPIR